ncbi:MAG: hypothetical protein K2J82_10855, partial [Muribaculaceae bacterium]|nr:hypothetical protein [Muribaculaceae bacterium]
LANQIPSHEEELVRRFSTEALLEKYQFSNIYSRERQSETEEDRLFSLLPTALTVLKSGILDCEIQKQFQHFKEISGKGNTEEEQKIQIELTRLLKLRSEMAKNIGDRILYPGKGR